MGRYPKDNTHTIDKKSKTILIIANFIKYFTALLSFPPTPVRDRVSLYCAIR